MAEGPGPSSGPLIRSKRSKVTKDHVVPDTEAAAQEPIAPVFTRKLRKAAVGTGCDIRLRVSVAGFPKPSLVWYHDDELLPPSEAQDSGGLWIRDCQTSHAGLYTCVATNDLGEASSSAVLAIMDLGEDSETTEDEATEPQVPMETKDGPGRHQDKSGRRGPSADGGRMMDYGPDALDRRAALPGGYDPVVERELRALGSRPPGPHLDPSNPNARQALDQKSHSLCKNGIGTPTQDQSVGGAAAKSKASDPQSAKRDQKSPMSADSSGMTPKLARAGPNIFDKVRAFEERRASLPGGGGAVSGRALAGLGRAASCDSDDNAAKTGGPNKQEGRILQDAAKKRVAFKQRASSLEDKTSYSQRVQSYQSKFAEELQRIKKLVGKPSMKKAFSTEQLPQRERATGGKVQPIPPQVVEKLEARERALEGRRDGSDGVRQNDGEVTRSQSAKAPRDGKTQTNSQEEPVGSSSPQCTGKISVTMETAPVHQLPRQPLPTGTKMSLSRETPQSSPAVKPFLTTDKDLMKDRSRDPQSHRRSPSPTGGRASPLSVRESGAVQSVCPAKPPRLTPSPTPSASPLLKRRKAEVGRSSPAPKLTIPTILVEDEPMETGSLPGGNDEGGGNVTRKSEGSRRKSRKGRPVPPASPEEGDASDDSYMSAEDEPAEGPPLVTVASTGREEKGSRPLTGATPAQGGRPAGSPAQWDEDPLSPQGDAMEVGDAPSVHLQEAPSFQVAPCDQTVTEGQDFSISVRVCGRPNPLVYWLKDRVSLKTVGRFTARETEDGSGEMRVSSAQRSDAGLYVCRIINEHGAQQAQCRVEVKAASAPTALSVTREVQDVAVRAGESAMFECHMGGPPDVEVDWLTDGKLIQPALLNCKMHFDGKRCRLLLNSVHEDDSGTYVCKLSTAKEEVTTSARLKVTPTKEPLFTRKLDILEVIEGRTARFDCKVSGSPAPKVTWMHFEARVEESDNIRFLQEGGRHSLVIAHVSSDTEGFYSAVAQNFHGKSQCTAELYVQESRAAITSHMTKLEKMPSIPEEPESLDSEVEKRTMPDFVKPLADVEVIEGKEALLKCKVSGLPYPTIAWYHNGKRIESSEERKMTQYRDAHSLLIRSACHAHGGVYKSVIANKVGKAACYAHLYVTDIIPDPPDGAPVIEAITGKTISLSWKRPKRLDPSLDVSSLLYTLQQQPLGSIQWSVVASNLRETGYTVTSLPKGVRYAFRVVTSTGKTLSKPSPSSDLVQLLDKGPYLRKAPIIADKPEVVFVVENQPASITITLNHVHAAVTWKRRGVVLASRPGVCEMSMPDDDQHCLKLQRVRSTDVGQLVVMASNQFGSDLCTLQLAAAEPPKFETIMEDLDVDVGETSRLAVVVEGKPEPDILWYKDDELLSESSHFTFVYDDPEYSLVVLNAQPEHSGVYTSTAKNLAGSNSCKAEVTVHTERKQAVEPMEDEGTILRKMRRLTDYYDIHKEIGRGAFSYVKRATQKKGKAEFAAKFTSARGKRKAAALHEMELLSDLDHQRILYFHDAFEKKNVLVLITELCHEEFLGRIAKKTTVLESEIRSGVKQVVEGLRYLHGRNIAHLDIKPENVLMSSPSSDQIRICDFGNALKLEASEERYCKYGTPEYVAPEIVNQTPVSMATDIWPVGVITYLCLTGVSPFAGENDRATALNIRNYNVAFEESMFSDFGKEAKGFVIKLLVVDRLRPSAMDCLRHSWFKATTNKSISTAMLKQVLARRRWQRSLINYKSKMVMRTIPELLDDSSSHVSIAVARHLKEGSPPPSSSSDSDADVDELPFIPMPLSMAFSGSRVSLNEIPGDEDVAAWPSGAAGVKEDREVEGERGAADEGMRDEEGNPDEEKTVKTKRAPLKKGSSVESEESQTKARRATMRRGSSADSALLLHIDADEGAANENAEACQKSLKKAVSMELPDRSPSPGAANLSQEDYALKLELMRQRLLRGGNMEKKMSGLRGPLFETLGMDDERRTGSLDRNLRSSRAPAPTLARAASSENPMEDHPKTRVFRKSSSFTQGDSEPMPLHRRFGAPLEIPSASNSSIEGKKLQEATSMSALTEETMQEPTSSSPTHNSSFILPSPDRADQPRKELQDMQRMNVRNTKINGMTEKWTNAHLESPSVLPPAIVIEDSEEERKSNHESNLEEEDDSQSVTTTDDTKSTDTSTLPEHPAVFAKVASADQSVNSIVPDCPTTPRRPVLRTDIKDIDSQEVFEARFKKRESSLTRGLKRLTRNKSEEEKSPVMSRRASGGGEDVYRPGQTGGPLQMAPVGLQEKSKSVQDLREVDKEVGLSLLGRLSLRGKRSPSADKKAEKSKGERAKEEKPQGAQETSASKRVSWAIGRSKSLDTTVLNSAAAERQLDEREQRKTEESTVSSMRRRFESKVAGIAGKIRTQSEERKGKDGKTQAEGGQKDLAAKDLKTVSDSPVLAMKQRFEDKVAAASTKSRSQSEERMGESEGKRTPLFSRHRHSQSEGRGLKGMGIPENQLAKQTGGGASKESIESTASVQSEKASESDRRSRWDRWGLTRSRKDKKDSQPDLAPPGSTDAEDASSHSQHFIRSASDFAPVFHIKLRDQVLLEGEPVTLSCLPAGSPHPEIAWMKDRKPLVVVEDRVNLISHPDGRQLLRMMRTSRRDAGVYECVAANPIATITTSCTISIACVPKRPETPEVAQTYNNTALVLWKPADTKAPCSYNLERKTEGEANWLTVATGVTDCYYNVTDLPLGDTFRFRVACVNKAGQGPHSNSSAPSSLHSKVGGASPAVVVVQTVPTPAEPTVAPSHTAPPLKFVQINSSSSSSHRDTAPPALSPASTASPPSKLVTPPTPPSSSPSSPETNPPSLSAGASKEEAANRKISPSLPSSTTVKPPPPFVLPKPQSPVNVVSPMTQTPPISPTSSLVTPPPTPTKPAFAALPTYVPPTTASRVTPSPVCFTPQVLQASGLSPIGEGAGTPTQGTPSGRATPSTGLRQGIPQKPYTFLEEKARGRFGVVRECRENATGKIFMAKIVPYNKENKQNILREYEILKSLHNEKVMALHEAYVTPRYLVLVADNCTGKELLYSLIDRFRYSEDDVVGYLVQILQGVEYLHNRRVLHLDLKPDNIMVTSLNSIKIVDFGSAQSFNPLHLTQQESGTATGILEYMAPEMVKGDVLGPPADIWAIGVITYIMLSGRLPFEDKDPLQIESKIQIARFDPTKLYSNVSQSASTFLKKMLSSYPWARPTTRDCFTHAWLQDSYLMKLRRQTLTFTTSQLKEFLVEQQNRRTESATKHKVLLRTYQGSPKTANSGTPPQGLDPK
ncbi:striated muscle preferentially expressed protein kinase-like [Genypterus blacodes]|uniref:striated muscle preferentially expressed protein kinase-like n=1 Tax=Genypterus blacodes TaxID=154954 RepID=UPI003F759295